MLAAPPVLDTTGIYGVDNKLVLWLLLSSACTTSKFSLFFVVVVGFLFSSFAYPVSRLGGGKRLGENTAETTDLTKKLSHTI